MLFKCRRLVPLLAVLFAVAGCGGGTHHAVAHSAVVQQTTTAASAGHPCDPANYTMQCGLQGQFPPIPQGAQAPTIQGVDFAWGGPRSCGQMGALGAHIAASYYSFDRSKGFDAGLVNALHACGITTVPVWETTADRATQGFNAGFQDAFNARAYARSVGEPDNRPIDYAVDCDCSVLSISGYFQGADAGTASVLHISHAAAVQLVDAYGGYFQILGLYNAHLVGHTNWQTYAWSRGLWLPASIAPFEQFDNSNPSWDRDRAIAADYGQFPYTPPPPPGPSHKQVVKWQGARNASLRAYHGAGCTRPVLGPENCRTFAQRVVYFVGKLDSNHVQATPHCWGKHAELNAAACQIVRPRVAIRSHARDATGNALDLNGCNGIATWGLPTNSPLCNRLRARQAYFQRLVTADLKAFR